MQKKENNKSKELQNEKEIVSKILILYDEYQFSSEKINEKINNIYKAIESNNNNKNKKKKLFHNEKNSLINLENKYYKCEILYEIIPINKMESLDLSIYEGIILFLEVTSIKNKVFSEKKHFFKDEHDFSSCIIIFEEDREDIQKAELFQQFIGETIDKHFEVICNCYNLKEYDEDDGIAAINLSLHSTQWKASKIIDNKKEIKKEDDKKEDIIDENKDKNNDKNFYQKLKDDDEIEKVFGKIKEIKQINSNPNISNEERRNNAEKAVMMLMEMFGLDDEDEVEEQIKKREEKDKENEK